MSPAVVPMPAALGSNTHSSAFVPASYDAASGSAQLMRPGAGTVQSVTPFLSNSGASLAACFG